MLCLNATPHHFAYLYDQREFLARDVLLVLRGFVSDAAVAVYAPYFERIEWWDSLSIRRGDRPVIPLTLFRARDFRRPLPITQPP